MWLKGRQVKVLIIYTTKIYYKNMNKEIKIIDDESKITCRICGKRLVRVYRHLNAHDMTSEDYLKLYPDAPLTTAADAKKTSINSGKHMKQEKYKKMFSEKFKGEKNPMHRSNTTEQHRKEISPLSVEFWKKRNPDWTEEQCVEAVKGVAAKVKEDRLIPQQKEYWIEKGYSEEEAVQKVSDYQRTFSKDICIEKYGEEEGLKVWVERQKKWNDSFKKMNYSMISQKLFVELWENIKDDYKVYFATLNENKIYEGNDRNFEYKLVLNDRYIRPDFFVPKLNKIIEFDGTYYHRNTTENKKREAERDKSIIESGYEVLHITEKEFIQDKDQTIKKCLDFLFSDI